MLYFLKFLHVACAFIWIGALLMLSYLWTAQGREEPAGYKRMHAWGRRVYVRWDLPALVGTVVLGVILFFMKHVAIAQGWLHMKWTFTVVLIVCDVWLGRQWCRPLGSLKKRSKGVLWVPLGVVVCSFLGVLASIYILKP